MKEKGTPFSIIGIIVVIVAIATFAIFNASAPTKNSPTGFRLPEGDAEQGQIAFNQHGCTNCHSIQGLEDTFAASNQRITHVILGGKVTRVKTYANLVTAIINPSHSILNPADPTQVNSDGTSKMPDLTQTMTVAEMTNLVTFLQPQYRTVIGDYTGNYTYYGHDSPF